MESRCGKKAHLVAAQSWSHPTSAHGEQSWLQIFLIGLRCVYTDSGSNSGTHCEVALRWMPQNLTKEKWNFLRLLSNWMRGKQFQSNLNSATARGPFRKQFFQQHSNAMEISFYLNRNSNKVITTKLCTWHNHCTVVGFWHVQKFVAIWWPTMELQQSEVSIEFELRAKIVIETGPRPRPCAMWSNVP